MRITIGGRRIWGVKKRWDQVEGRYALYQTVVTAVIANRALLDGVDVVVQQPAVQEEEAAYLRETVQEKSCTTRRAGSLMKAPRGGQRCGERA